MSDNLPYKSDVNKFVAADEIGGVHHQRVKIEVGGDGVANDIQPFDADAKSSTGLLPAAAAVFNGTSWDRVRGNIEGSLLASAVRTTTTSSPDQTNYNHVGVQVALSITVGATLSLVLTIEAKDPVSGSYYALNAAPTAVTGTGLTVYTVYPGVGAASGGVTQRTSAALPRTWRATVTAGNANSATYSVGYSLII